MQDAILKTTSEECEQVRALVVWDVVKACVEDCFQYRNAVRRLIISN